MAHILIWYNPKKQEYYNRLLRLRSQYDINDINKHGHILVNVIHCAKHMKKPYAVSFNAFNSLSDAVYNRTIIYDHFKHLPNRLKKDLGDYLVRVGKSLNK